LANKLSECALIHINMCEDEKIALKRNSHKPLYTVSYKDFSQNDIEKLVI